MLILKNPRESVTKMNVNALSFVTSKRQSVGSNDRSSPNSEVTRWFFLFQGI